MSKYNVVPTTKFKKDLKLAKKRRYNLSLLGEIVDLLTNGQPLPEKNKFLSFQIVNFVL